MKKVHWVLIGSFIALVVVFSIGFGLRGGDFFTALVFNPSRVDQEGYGGQGGGGSGCSNDPSFTGSMPSPWIQLDAEKIVGASGNGYNQIAFQFDPIKLSQIRFVNSGSDFYRVRNFSVFNTWSGGSSVTGSRNSEKRCGMTYFGTSHVGSPSVYVNRVTIEARKGDTNQIKMQLWGLPR